MKFFGGAAKFTQFVNSKGIQYYPINMGTWYGINGEGYIKKITSVNNVPEYTTVKFNELASYLNDLADNTVDTPYKIHITETPSESLTSSRLSGTVGYILNNSNKYVSLKLDIPETLTTAPGLFMDCVGLVEIDTSIFVNFTETRYMFSGCTNLKNIETANNFTNVTNAEAMFENCSSLTYIDTSGFTKVTKASDMFKGCSSLTSIDTSAFTHVTNANGMFQGCTGLSEIDGSYFNNISSIANMFNGCTLSLYYASESDILYSYFRNSFPNTITWVKK